MIQYRFYFLLFLMLVAFDASALTNASYENYSSVETILIMFGLGFIGGINY